MLQTWYIPSWCGDFRLEAKDDDECVLKVEDPTSGELEQLGKFLVKARKKGLVGDHEGIADHGKSELLVKGSVAAAGKLLLGRKAPRRGILTAVKSEKGKLTVVKDEEGLEEVISDPRAEKAVTTRRPTLCCPDPVSGPDRRASEVLREFCTDQQWNDWINNGFLFCRGNLSGRLYRIVHRHHPLARKQGKIVWDMSGNHVVDCWDWSVPPPEEALACKLAFEHAEEWVRNRSSVFVGFHGPNHPELEEPYDEGMFLASYPNLPKQGLDLYINPFMPKRNQMHDGLLSTGICMGVGRMLQGLGPRKPGRPKGKNV